MATLPFPCSANPLQVSDFNSVMTALNVDAPAIWAILAVESGRAGYFPDRRPQILFERATFSGRTKGAYDQSNPGISASTWGGYAGGPAEYGRLGEAYALSPEDALASASWGIAQIMGFNYVAAGYASPTDWVQDSCVSEANQLLALQRFLIHTGIVTPLAAHQWDQVAAKYNGQGQVAHYSGLLQQNYLKFQDPTNLPDFDVRAAQLYLSYLSVAENNPAFDPKGVDGIIGVPGKSHTLLALNAFQNAQGLAPTTTVDDNVLSALETAQPAAANLLLS